MTDANGVVLGRVMSIGVSMGSGHLPAHPGYVTIRTSTGHIVSLGLDGLVNWGQIYWNGGNCGAGTGILNTGLPAIRKGFCKLVVRGANGLYATGGGGCDSDGLVSSQVLAGPTTTNIESSGSCSTSASGNSGYVLTPVTHTDIGLPAVLARPFSF